MNLNELNLVPGTWTLKIVFLVINVTALRISWSKSEVLLGDNYANVSLQVTKVFMTLIFSQVKLAKYP